MDPTSLGNRAAWGEAYRAQLQFFGGLPSGDTLVAGEYVLLQDILATRPLVVRPQSGNGEDDIALVRAGARAVIGADYSEIAVTQAQARADRLDAACRYVLATVPGVPLR